MNRKISRSQIDAWDEPNKEPLGSYLRQGPPRYLTYKGKLKFGSVNNDSKINYSNSWGNNNNNKKRYTL